MWVAVVAFVGGVVAVALKSWIDYTLQSRRIARIGLRVATEEAREAVTLAASALESGIWLRFTTPPGRYWAENRILLAGALDDRTWTTVVNTHERVQAVYFHTLEWSLGTPLSDSDREFLQEQENALRYLSGRLHESAVASARGPELLSRLRPARP